MGRNQFMRAAARRLTIFLLKNLFAARAFRSVKSPGLPVAIERRSGGDL
jgi:hypothetical protein